MIEACGGAFHGIGSLLDSYDFAKARGRVHAAAGCTPKYVRSYADYAPACNAWAKEKGNFSAVGSVWPSRQFPPNDDLAKTEFYANWLRPQGWFHSIRCVVHREGDEVWCLTVAAPQAAPPYTEHDVALLRRLAPHIDRALRIQRDTSELRHRNEAAMGVLDHLSVGVVLVSETGRVIEMNAAAKDIFTRRDGLSAGMNRLEAMHNGDNEGLRALVTGVADSGDGADPMARGTIALRRPSGRRPLSVFVTSVTTSESVFDSGTSIAAVFIFDPERPIEIDRDHLSQLYGLTRTEARLASRLAAGRRLDETAKEMGISSLTARTHLKHIFSKTGIERQADLVRLLLSGLGQMHSA